MSSTAPPTDARHSRVIFSVGDGYAKITTLAPGALPGRMNPRWWLLFVVSTAVWALVWLLATASLAGACCDASPPMPWLPLIVLLVVLLLFATAFSICLQGAAKAVFGQSRAANKLGWAPARLGVVAASLVWIVAEHIAMFWAAIPVAWALLEAITIRRALAHARMRQEGIHRLRQSGRRAEAVLTDREFRRLWIYDNACFTVTVRFPDPWGTPTTLQAKLFTVASQVPVIGTALLVITDDDGATLVELADPDSVEFEHDYAQWEVPESG